MNTMNNINNNNINLEIRLTAVKSTGSFNTMCRHTETFILQYIFDITDWRQTDKSPVTLLTI